LADDDDREQHSWRNVCAIQAMLTISWPLLSADGRLINASMVNRYAQIIVPTIAVIFTASQTFRRPKPPAPSSAY